MLNRKSRTLAAGLAALIMSAVVALAIEAPASAAGGVQLRSIDAPGKCLDVTGVSQDNGAPLQMYDCLGAAQTNQRFYLFYVRGSGTPGRYQIVAQHSGKCLDVAYASTAEGAPIIQYDCQGYTHYNQIWQRYDTGTQYVKYQAWHSGRYLNFNGAYNGAAVVQKLNYTLWYGVVV